MAGTSAQTDSETPDIASSELLFDFIVG